MPLIESVPGEFLFARHGFISIFSCLNNAHDLKTVARYFTLEEVLERVVNDEEVSDFDDESEEDLPEVSESENNGDSSEVRANSSK